jgi:hypothetical protein
MRVIYTSKGISKKFGVRVIYRKIRYISPIFMGKEIRPFKMGPTGFPETSVITTIHCIISQKSAISHQGGVYNRGMNGEKRHARTVLVGKSKCMTIWKI